MQVKHLLEFKCIMMYYTQCIMDESGTEEVMCLRKVASGRRVAGEIRSLVNGRGLQLECPRVSYETLLVSVLMYGSDTLIWEEKSRIRAAQMEWIKSQMHR